MHRRLALACIPPMTDPTIDRHIQSLERPDKALWTYYLLSALVIPPLFPFLAPFFWFRYSTMRYKFTDDGISMSWGILFRREVIVNGTQDMLSMYYQLVLLAPTQGALDMPIATGRKLENYRFEVLGEETLALPAGQRRALRVRTRSGGDTIELWLHAGEGAASRGLPLKIRFIDRKGEIFDQIADEAGETQ